VFLVRIALCAGSRAHSSQCAPAALLVSSDIVMKISAIFRAAVLVALPGAAQELVEDVQQEVQSTVGQLAKLSSHAVSFLSGHAAQSERSSEEGAGDGPREALQWNDLEAMDLVNTTVEMPVVPGLNDEATREADKERAASVAAEAELAKSDEQEIAEKAAADALEALGPTLLPEQSEEEPESLPASGIDESATAAPDQPLDPVTTTAEPTMPIIPVEEVEKALAHSAALQTASKQEASTTTAASTSKIPVEMAPAGEATTLDDVEEVMGQQEDSLAQEAVVLLPHSPVRTRKQYRAARKSAQP